MRLHGILNCASTKETIQGFTGIDDKKTALLKEISDIFVPVIVLTSSWKETWSAKDKSSQDEFADTLDRKLAMQGLRISEKTFDHGPDRGEGILAWMEEYGPVSGYLILDDEIFDFKEMGISPHWLQTSYNYNGGLKENHVRYLKRHKKNYYLP